MKKPLNRSATCQTDNRAVTTIELLQNSNLVIFNCKLVYWNHQNLLILFRILSETTSLKSLNISFQSSAHNQLPPSLLNFLRANTNLTALDIYDFTIKSNELKKLLQSLITNTNLSTLNLRYTYIGNEGVPYLANFLKINTSITSLNLKANSIFDAGFKAILCSLTNSGIKALDLTFNHTTYEYTHSIAKFLSLNNNITSLNLEDVGLRDNGTKQLALSLKFNTSLTTLNLARNQISTLGTKYLSQMLCVNTALTHLNLAYNHIISSDIKHLSQALKVNTTLTYLSLKDNRIKQQGFYHLLDLLRVNTSLTTLNLVFNYISIKPLEPYIQTDTTLYETTRQPLTCWRCIFNNHKNPIELLVDLRR